jgi:very-short-patch-repair endonuclease
MVSNSVANSLWGYLVDFVCLEKRLVVEVDGGQHAENANYDKERDAWLNDQEFVVLRYWNHDVLRRIDAVMNVIIEKLQSTPYLNPSPQGGTRKTSKGRGFSRVLL